MYFLFPSRDMNKILLKRRKSSQPQPNSTVSCYESNKAKCTHGDHISILFLVFYSHKSISINVNTADVIS